MFSDGPFSSTSFSSLNIAAVDNFISSVIFAFNLYIRQDLELRNQIIQMIEKRNSITQDSIFEYHINNLDEIEFKVRQNYV